MSTSKNEIVSSEWSSDKTVKQNLESMGLAYDPNRIMGLSLNEPTTADMETEEIGNLEQATTLGSLKKQRENAVKKVLQINWSKLQLSLQRNRRRTEELTFRRMTLAFAPG